METLALILAGTYMLILFIVTIYSLGQFQLLMFYRRNTKRGAEHLLPSADVNSTNLPIVTIQLPVYNELYVVERLIDAITALEYPKDKLEIQLLDDSTDESVEIAARRVAHYKELGFNIEQIRRKDRKGFKAGALSEGLLTAKGEFVAIFDADFIPHTDFLLRTIPYFSNPKVGVVQTRWEHLNKNYSLLTKLQAIQLDVHFTVEQMGRCSGDCLLQFNGTGGVWRRSTIDDAGGWEADTLTEDLDLSYRAQLKGWKIQFVEAITSPGELPAEMNGFKSQQFRWMKGGAETARKMMPIIWKSKLSLWQKIHGSFHLMGSSLFVLVLLMAILNLPIFFLREYLPAFDLRYLPVFYASFVLFTLVSYTANVQTLNKDQSYAKRLFKFVSMYPLFMAMSIGMSLHNTVAVVQGWIGKKTAFVRTPKFNIVNLGDGFNKGKYLNKKISWVTIFEGVLCLCFLYTMTVAYSADATNYFIFHLIYALGFGTICFYSIRHLGLK